MQNNSLNFLSLSFPLLLQIQFYFESAFFLQILKWNVCFKPHHDKIGWWMYMLPMCTHYSPVVGCQALTFDNCHLVLLLLHKKLPFQALLWLNGFMDQGDETCSVSKGPHWPWIELQFNRKKSVFFVQQQKRVWGVGSVYESKIVASLNRQLGLLCFCPPLTEQQ